MDHQSLRAHLPSLIAGHLPRNARRYYFRTYDGQPQISPLGLCIDPRPFQGTVIAKTDEALIVKTGRVAFAAIDRHLASADPEPGARVEVAPYARRDFSGARIDAPVEERHEMSNGQTYTVQKVSLGGRTVLLPLPPPRYPQLDDLKHQLEVLPAPDGFRTIVHLLVDAGAHAFSCVDPEPEDIQTPPEIAFHVDTGKFVGQVAILYDRGLDLYAVELRDARVPVTRIDPVDFTSLGKTLEDLIDDGHWRHIQITVLGHTSRRRH